jgi:mannosyltransferase
VTFPVVLALLGIVSFGVLIRCHRLNEISYWFDESFCWKMTTFAWSEQWERVAGDNHPPLYFFLLKLWTQLFGDTAVSMRTLSVLCGAAVILGGFQLVLEIERGLGPAARPRPIASALLAAAGLALSPFQVEWSQQVRMYALGSALALWSSWFLLRMLQTQPPLKRYWVGFVLTGAALAYTHYYCLFVLAAQFVFAACAVLRRWVSSRSEPSQRVGIWQVPLAFVVIGMIWSPWLPQFLLHRQQVVDSFWTRPLKLEDVTWTCVQMWTGTWTQLPFEKKLAEGSAIAALLVCLWQLFLGRGGRRLLALIPLITFAAAIGASLGPRNILSPRYFVFAQALLVCCAAVCVQRLPGAWVRYLCSLLALAGLGWLCWGTVQQRDRWASRPGFESAVAYLDGVREPGEPVFVGNPMVQINVAAYAAEPDEVFVLSNQQTFPYFQGSAVMRTSEYRTSEQVSQWTSDRIWVIETKNWTGGSIGVTLPSPWVDIRDEAFFDWHTPKCEVVVKECVRRRSAKGGSPSSNHAAMDQDKQP